MRKHQTYTVYNEMYQWN